jgi:hypothetical protein
MWFNWMSKSPTKTSAHRHIRPTLEVLEDRTVPSVDIVYSGGPTIPNVQVNNIVMGPQPVDTTAMMQALVHDYLPLLGPYYGIGAGTLRSSASVAPLPGIPSNLQIENMIVQEINSGVVPTPDGNQVYFVFLPPGQTVLDVAGTDTTGYHSNFYVYHDATGYHQATIVPAGTPLIPVYYAVSLGTTSSVSVTASHELAESVTDPNGTGFRDPTNPFGGEVADIYEFLPTFTLDGYPVSVLSGPQGQKIGVASSGTMQDFFNLVIDEAEAMAFHYLSMIDPQLAADAQAASMAVNANPFYGSSEGQMGVLLGQALCASWFSH